VKIEEVFELIFELIYPKFKGLKNVKDNDLFHKKESYPILDMPPFVEYQTMISVILFHLLLSSLRH
jgi:hypothetical protein